MYIKHSILLILSLPICGLIFSQKSYQVRFQVDQAPDYQFRLIYYYGDQQIKRDSSVSDSKGFVEFRLNENDEAGMYRLEKDTYTGLDFLFKQEDIDISAANNLELNGIVVRRSKENEIFFDYYRHKRDYEGRIELLSYFNEYYPKSDTFYVKASAHLALLKKTYANYLDSLKKNFPDYLATHLIGLDQLPKIRPGSLDPVTMLRYRSEYFDGIDLTDSLILHSPLLPAKVIDYLSVFVVVGVPRDIQEMNFIQAVDSLMKFTENGPEVREMVVNYLIDGFQAYGYEKVMTYLVENYVIGQQCVSDHQEEKLRYRIEGFRKLAAGSQAPVFEMNDSEGNLFQLDDNRNLPVLLIFWSGKCPHCETVMPELKKLYSQYKDKVRFVSISVDQDERTWREALQRNSLPWSNLAELKGWDGKIVKDYYVYATPTFYYIDGDLKIKAKPAGIVELRDALAN